MARILWVAFSSIVPHHTVVMRDFTRPNLLIACVRWVIQFYRQASWVGMGQFRVSNLNVSRYPAFGIYATEILPAGLDVE